MARRSGKTGQTIGTVAKTLLATSFRFPIVGALVAIALTAAWWWLRGRPDDWYGAAKYVARVAGGIAIFFAVLCASGIIWNLLPHDPAGTSRRRKPGA